MDALKFAREIKRMCESYPNGCAQCDLETQDYVHYCVNTNLEKAIPIVEKWSAEHPFIRNVDHVAELLEKAGYKVDKEFIIEHCCPPKLAERFTKASIHCDANCSDCHRWWLEEYKGEDISRWISTT